MTNKLPVLGQKYRVNFFINKIETGVVFFHFLTQETCVNLKMMEEAEQMARGLFGEIQTKCVTAFTNLADGCHYKSFVGFGSFGDNAEYRHLEISEEFPRAFATVAGNPDGSCTMIDFTEDNKKGMVAIFPDFAEEPNQPTETLKAEMAKEKKEISEVERALGRAWIGVDLAKEGGDYTVYCCKICKKPIKLAQNLVNSLESERNRAPCETNKIAVSQVKNDEKQPIFAHPCESKTEPKIDMKEECVEPVSIWKDVGESVKEYDLDQGNLVLANMGGRVTLEDIERVQMEFEKHQECCIYQKYASLTDFINSFEQMQKDIAELKRK